MAKVNNNFTNGKMDSDTHYSIIDNQSYVLAENLRLIGYGDDYSFRNLKGSKMVADYSENGTMTCVGIHRGLNNKMYFFLAHTNGKSKIVQYDVETGVHQLIIQDNTVLRFDLIRWNSGTEIKPYKYLLSFNQIGDLIIFSNEAWEHIRCVNLQRLSDYANGFTLEDITLSKKPPLKAPEFISRTKDANIQDENRSNRFVSFTYRYKYNDGDFSALSFFSDVAFEPLGGYTLNSKRENTGMVNKWNTYTLMVNSGGENVTDVEVYAKEHDSNALYLIYSANKAQNGIADNANISNIVYKFSNNFPILTDDEATMLYSNIPMYPKAQEAVGNRIFFGNYKEGFDLGAPVDFEVFKTQSEFSVTGERKTAVSLFRYKVAAVYLNDYNQATTALLPVNQSKSEVEVLFSDRFKNNHLTVKNLTPPPAGFTKLKFVVKSEELNYENLYINYGKNYDGYTYLLLQGDNIDKVKKGDSLIQVQVNAPNKELYVEDVLTMSDAEGFLVKGLYAKIINDGSIDVTPNGADVNYSYQPNYSNQYGSPFTTLLAQNASITDEWIMGIHQTSLPNSVSPTNVSYTLFWAFIDPNAIGVIKEGDVVDITIRFQFSLPSPIRQFAKDFKIQILALKEYNTIYDLMVDKYTVPYFNFSQTGGAVVLKTNALFADFVRATFPEVFAYKKIPLGDDMFVKHSSTVKVTRGIKPIFARTKNKETLNEFYFETPKTYSIVNGQYIPDRYEAGQPVFDIGFYNGYSWGNGVESYKIKDMFSGKALRFKERGTLYEQKGYKRIHRKTDITYSGIYNYELGINKLSSFNASTANWKQLPINYGEIQRMISTDGDITVFLDSKVINQYYDKSIIADLQGNENVAMTNEVLGGYYTLPYEYGISQNPESAVASGNLIYFTDKDRSRILIKHGKEITELNPARSGFHKESVDQLSANHNFIGAYNDAMGEFIMSLDHDHSLTFNMVHKGFTHYTTAKLEYHYGMGGSMFSAHKGRIYENEVTDTYSNLNGQGSFTARLRYVVNPEIDSDKVFKAISLQSNSAWNTDIKTNLTQSFIEDEFYVKRESFYYSDIYRDITQVSGDGIGEIKNISGNQITFSLSISPNVSVGDVLVGDTTNVQSEIINIQGNIITVADGTIFQQGEFAYTLKQYGFNYSPDGEPIRGKWMEVTLSQNTSEPIYITSCSTEIIKSY